MFQFDLTGLIPEALRRQAVDAAVDFVSEQAKKFLNEDFSLKIKKLRSDAAFQKVFGEGLQRAANRFAAEYALEDEDLVAALARDKTFFQNEAVQQAMLAILKKPGLYLAEEQEIVAQSFDTVLPARLNRERINRAVLFFLKCLAEEIWNLPELRPAYELQFQRMTAEAVREQVNLQKTQLQATVALSTDVRDALLQLTDAIAARKLLPGGDPLLALPAPKKIYHNLPHPDYERFVGRKAELKQIRQLLLPKTRHFVVTIDGIGGIGKSALALEVAHSYLQHSERLPEKERFEAIIWISAKQTVLTGEGLTPRSQALRTLDDIYTTMAITLEREEIIRARPEEQAELARQALAQQRTLLIVDNLETVDDERVIVFIREAPEPTKVIVTTRHRLDVAYPVRLAGMEEADALILIAAEAQKKRVTLTADETRRLYQRTGGIPLAIVWSVAQMSFGYGAQAVLTRLGRPTSDIARFSFEGAVERLKDKPAHRLLLALSLFATDASREALDDVAGLPELDRDEGLVELEKLSLVNKTGKRFSLLPLTASFASAQLKGEPELENSLRLAFIHYFLDFCSEFGGDQWLLYTNLDEDIKNIQLAVEWAYQLQMWPEVGKFANNLVEFLDRRGLWNELVQYSEMGLEAGREIDDKQLIMKHKIFGLGWAKAVRFGLVEEGLASIEEGKKLALALGNEREYAIALYDKGVIYRKRGDYEQAAELYRQSLEIWQKLGDHRWAIRTIGAVAKNERAQGNVDQAFAYHTEALKKSEETGDTEQIALNLWRLSHILWQRGQLDEAHANSREALRICEQFNIVNGIANCCLMLGRVKYSLGKIDDAVKLAERAAEIYDRLRSRHHLEETVELLEALKQSPYSLSAYLAKQS
jgi:tetratricopeptide (TPR) repeat protein